MYDPCGDPHSIHIGSISRYILFCHNIAIRVLCWGNVFVSGKRNVQWATPGTSNLDIIRNPRCGLLIHHKAHQPTNCLFSMIRFMRGTRQYPKRGGSGLTTISSYRIPQLFMFLSPERFHLSAPQGTCPQVSARSARSRLLSPHPQGLPPRKICQITAAVAHTSPSSPRSPTLLWQRP